MTNGKKRTSNDLGRRYLAALGARVAAESGRAADRHHLGRLVLRSLRDDPGFLHQIDGATGERERAGSVLARSVLCALALRRLGLSVGDVAAVLSPLSSHAAVPYYAALYLGVAVCAMDCTATGEELQVQLALLQPHVVFCADNAMEGVQAACVGLSCTLLPLDKDLRLFLEEHLGPFSEEDVSQFRANDFDPEETVAFLTPTSGTTGLPKLVACSHKNMVIGLPNTLHLFTEFPCPTRMVLLVSPLQWITATWMLLVTPLFRITRLQTSRTLDPQHSYELINRYQPTMMMCSPSYMSTLLQGGREQCDLTCFEVLTIGGNKVTKELIQEVNARAPNASVFTAYGLSESNALIFVNDETSRPWSVGRPVPSLQYKLVNTDTLEDVNEPYKEGELWIKGDMMFMGYFKAPEDTAEALAADGWFRTGDLFYQDDRNLYYFVERIKLMMKYRCHQISPAELEQVLSAHPGVAAAAVGSVSDAAAGDLPVAFVVRHASAHVTAQEIKDHVKEKLSDPKQLRGGVVFVDELPTTAAGKLHRRKIKEMAETMQKE